MDHGFGIEGLIAGVLHGLAFLNRWICAPDEKAPSAVGGLGW